MKTLIDMICHNDKSNKHITSVCYFPALQTIVKYAIISLAKCHANHGTTSVHSLLIEQPVKISILSSMCHMMLILQVQDFVTVSLSDHEFNTHKIHLLCSLSAG